MPELTYREAVRDALGKALREDDRVFIMGEDIAEMGGSMAVTQGLLDEFGPGRVRNTPISEMAIVGSGIGAEGSSEDKGYEATSAALTTAMTLRRIRRGYELDGS